MHEDAGTHEALQVASVPSKTRTEDMKGLSCHLASLPTQTRDSFRHSFIEMLGNIEEPGATFVSRFRALAAQKILRRDLFSSS